MSFSSRFQWNAKPNRLAQVLAQKNREGATVIDLTQSNPTHAGLRYPLDVMRAFEDSGILIYEPSPRGSPVSREAVANYYSRRGHSVSPERILLTASTSEAYSYLFKLLADPGDTVLVPQPSYPLFEYLAAMDSLRAAHYPLRYDHGWSMSLEQIPAGAKILALVNPNNPTGSFIKRGELERASELGMPIICDEVFADYAFGPDPERVASLVDFEACLSFSLSGLSKVAGLPQMKLGWIVVNGPEAERRDAMEKLEWIADTYLSVGAPVQCAAPKLLVAGEEIQNEIRARTAENLRFVRRTIAGSAASVLEVEAGWYATLRMPRVRSEEEYAIELLEDHGVLVQPGYFYDFESEAYLVVSLLTEEGQFREGIERVRDLAKLS